jgi:hypothetical protein
MTRLGPLAEFAERARSDARSLGCRVVCCASLDQAEDDLLLILGELDTGGGDP